MSLYIIHIEEVLDMIKQEDVTFSLDIGTRSVIGTVGVIRDKKFQVIAEKYTEHNERAMIDGQIHDISLVSKAVGYVKRELEEELGIELKKVAIAAAGRFLRTTVAKSEIEIDDDKEIDKELVRSLELTAVKNAEEKVNKQVVGKLYSVGYSVKNYFLNGYAISNLLSHKGQVISVEIISTFLPRSVVDSLYAVTKKLGLTVTNLTLEPIAAMEAAIPQNLRLLNLALVDIGAGTSDVAISSNETISAYGMAAIAGDEVTEAIAQACLVDFNTAETIKRNVFQKGEYTYTDVLGIENLITSDEVKKIIKPVAVKMSEEIGKKIIELNGGKATNAVFLVGGGAHTPLLKELLAEKLNLPPQRIAIKGRESVTDCICLDNELGSTGVTVLGIALVAIKKFGGDFIDVFLNNSVISLFNSKSNTVMDVVLQAGMNPKVLIGKNGKNIRFTLNGSKRVAFGTIAKSAVIKINGVASSIDSEIKENDKIEIQFSQNGNNAQPKIKDYVKKLDAIGFYLNDIVKNMEPLFFINKEKVSLDSEINEGDVVEIVFPKTVEDYKRYYDNDLNLEIYKDNQLLMDSYIIEEGDRLYTKAETIEDIKDEVLEEIMEPEVKQEEIKLSYDNIIIKINGEDVTLKGKEKYIFVDIFNFYEFDLTVLRGQLVMLINGEKAGFSDPLKEGDNVEIRWESFPFEK
jgi:cell division protein FtsA